MLLTGFAFFIINLAAVFVIFEYFCKQIFSKMISAKIRKRKGLFHPSVHIVLYGHFEQQICMYGLTCKAETQLDPGTHAAAYIIGGGGQQLTRCRPMVTLGSHLNCHWRTTIRSLKGTPNASPKLVLVLADFSVTYRDRGQRLGAHRIVTNMWTTTLSYTLSLVSHALSLNCVCTRQ